MSRPFVAYACLGLLLTPLPLLNVLQAESSAVVAFGAFFVAGFSSLGAFRAGESFHRVVLRQEGALLVPLGILTVAQLWAPNCTYLQGLLFYALFPGVTVVFAVSIAYALSGTTLRRPGLHLGGVGLLIAVGGPLYDLGLHPQFYTYNHVFGGVLGPIYDEQLALRSGLFAFRGLTLLWAVACFLIGQRLRGEGGRWSLPICAVGIGLMYVFSAPLGFNTPAWYLKDQLGGHKRTPNFDLYYDPGHLEEADLAMLAQAHEDRYEWVRRQLHLAEREADERIQSYIYPSPEVKGRLTGAKTTSVSPVWLTTPQIHLLRKRIPTSLGHELAHVVSRPYGLPGLKASWTPGLIEGWAVALEPPSPRPSPDDLVRTGAIIDTSTNVETHASAIAKRLSPWNFWTGRSSVSYATMGSFVQYLLERYGPQKLKRVYAWGSFETVYGRRLRSLATDWAEHLRRKPIVARGAYGIVSKRFTTPSLFEAQCPHFVPPSRRHLQAAQQSFRRHDTTRGVRRLRKALDVKPGFPAAHALLAKIRLRRGHEGAVVHQLDTLRSSLRTPQVLRLLADAVVLSGRVEKARGLYKMALAETPHYRSGTRVRFMLRDAVAHRASVVDVLVGGDSALVQARRLSRLGEGVGAATRAWRGLRLMEGHSYARARDVWKTVTAPIPSGRPRGWRREWAVQRKAWGSEAAYRAGSRRMAAQWARRAARLARTYGDRTGADRYDWWAKRTGTQGGQ